MAGFPCPNCGRKNRWKADYYEAVSQTCIVLTGEDGAPEIVDWTGTTDSYDDGDTEVDALRCTACGHEVPLARMEFISTAEQERLAGVVSRLEELVQGLRGGGPLMHAVSTVQEASEALSKLAGKVPAVSE